MSDTTITFVGASRGNAFMNELLGAVAHEVAATGARTEVVLDAFPLDGKRAYVVVPHEFFACVPIDSLPGPAQLGRTIAFCVEQPGTPWFDQSVCRALQAGAAVDISPVGVQELRRRGVRAERFRLGYTSFWDRWHGDDETPRPVEIVHLGSATVRRCAALASYARTLWPYEARLLLAHEEPKTTTQANFLTGADKWELLASSQVLLNIHRQETPYFEWVRVLEAIANGCVVVSEHSVDHEPLVPGEHFVGGDTENLAVLAVQLLQDQDRLRAMRRAAYDLVREQLPMRPAAERLVEIAERLARRRARKSVPRKRWSALDPVRRVADRASHSALAAGKTLALEDAEIAGLLEMTQAMDRRLDRTTSALKQLVLDSIELRRTLREQLLNGTGDLTTSVIAETPSYRDAQPRVSVLVPLYNHAYDVGAAVASVAGSEFQSLELLVLDDGSADPSSETVQALLAARPSLPAALLGRPINRGLGRTRNELVQHARGEYVFALDADNEIYPTALARLVTALDGDPGATFAYTMLEEHEDGTPVRLRSFQPWEPHRLREDNYVDAMAMLRREHVLALGGYSEDLRLYGWEDYELWLRCAATGRYGVLVPQILGRYRSSPHSMLAVTDIDNREVRGLLSRHLANWPA